MRFSRCVFGMLALALCSSFCMTENEPTKNNALLSADEIAIYKIVLQQYISKDTPTLNVSIRTYPLDPASNMNGLHAECLKDIQLENLPVISHTFHELTPDVLPAKNVKLVDPRKQSKMVRSNDPDNTIRQGKSVDSAVKEAFGTALFSMSEIGFDKNHHYAVVAYRFWCGSLYGNGSTLVFEKAGSEWKRMQRNCGGWVS